MNRYWAYFGPISWVIKCPHVSHHPTIRFHDRYMVFLMATISGDVQYTQVMGHLTTPV